MPPMPRPWFLFAHGAGAPSSSTWMRRWRDHLRALGEVVTFDYPYMQARRKMPDRMPALVAAHREALAKVRAEANGAPIILAGVLTRNGTMSGPLAMASCLIGVLLGDMVVYFLGFFYGEKVLSLPLTRRVLSRQWEAQIKGYFHRHGFKILVSGRFVPGFRTAAYLTAAEATRESEKSRRKESSPFYTEPLRPLNFRRRSPFRARLFLPEMPSMLWQQSPRYCQAQKAMP